MDSNVPENLLPLSPEETEKWIGEVEDRAWDANATSFACRFLLGNLLAELNARSLVNAPAFLARLKLALSSGEQDHLSAQQQLGLTSLLDDLQLFFATPENSAAGSSSSFH